MQDINCKLVAHTEGCLKQSFKSNLFKNMSPYTIYALLHTLCTEGKTKGVTPKVLHL